MMPVTSRRRVVERAMPHRGPCGFCGGEDARHRVWDAWRGRLIAGESAAEVADDYEVPLPVVLAVVRGPRWWR